MVAPTIQHTERLDTVVKKLNYCIGAMFVDMIINMVE